jgi:large conductance mechanosensitive channel
MLHHGRSLWKEFKSFAIKGNAFDLAIAVVVGTAFSAIVSSLVADVVTPLLGIITGNVDFKTLVWEVRPGLLVKYGAFMQAIFNFLVISVSIFLVFKAISSARKRLFKEEETTPPPPEEKPAELRLLEEIRDLLKQRN